MLEQVKAEVGRLRCDLVSRGEIAFQRPFVIKSIECIVRFILGALLSGAKILGGYVPFGAAITASSGSGVEGISCLLGVISGYLIFNSFENAVKYIAISLLVYAVAFTFRGTKVITMEWAMPLAAAFIAGCIGIVYTAYEGWRILSITMYISETILIGGAAYFFKIALSPWGGKDKSDGEMRHTVSMLLLIGCCLITAQRIRFDVISLGRTAAVFIVLVAGYSGGVFAGAGTGTAMGIAMDIGSGRPFFSMVYAFSGLISGVFHKQGKLFFVLAYIVANAAAVLWRWDLPINLGALYETFIATVVFMLIPTKRLAFWGAAFAGGGGSGSASGVRSYAASKLEKASLAFREVYESMRDSLEDGPLDGDIGVVFDAAAEKVCRKCRASMRCWNRDYTDTANAMNDATPKMLERGQLMREDFPPYFAQRCPKLDQFVEAANEELKALVYKRQLKARIIDNQSVLFSQYEELATVLKSVARELSAEMRGSPALEYKLQKYLKSVNIDAQTSVFRDSRGRLHVEIRSTRLTEIANDPEGLNKLSTAIGVRLCENIAEKRANGRMVLMEAEPFAASVGIASARKKGETVSGDSGTYFKSDEGILYVILSDGCGTGERASRESINALKLLERFLRAGIEPETALKILNSVILVRNSDGTLCMTVDLLSIDLFSGEARIYKYGAAPSYLKRGGDVRRYTGEALAAGLCLEGVCSADCIRLVLQEGDYTIIASDGVANPLDDEWLVKSAAGYDGGCARELALKLLEEAIEKYGQDDDMTVLTVLLQKRA